jgi:lysophospholipid acyltransferase (LPLAT)-like uncharacterized protein
VGAGDAAGFVAAFSVSGSVTRSDPVEGSRSKTQNPKRKTAARAWHPAAFPQKTARLNSSEPHDSPPASPAPAVAAPAPAVNEVGGWRLLVMWPLGLLLRLWGLTLRMEAAPADLARYTKNDEPIAIVLWHNRLFMAAEIVRRYRRSRPRPYALVSASKDGAWLSAFFQLAGLRTVRGSSSRLGREAASALVEMLRAGVDVGITPDGPRGPCYDFKPGAVIVARRTRVPMLLIGAEFEAAWRLRSWDRFYLPKPFSRVRMRSELILPEQLADRDAALAQLSERLLALNPDREARHPQTARLP